MPVREFLDSLRSISQSNYGFIAYIGVLAACVYIAVARARLHAMTKSLEVLAADERAEALRRLYPEYPTTGMSADDFIRSRRNAQILIAFIAVLVTIVAIVTLALTLGSGPHR